MNDNEKQKLDEISDIINAFAENEKIPNFLRWGLQVLFVCGASSHERSNVVAGLSACAERVFSEAIDRVRKSGDEAGARKLAEDKVNCLKMALHIDFAGAMASVLKQKLGELGENKNVIVGISTDNPSVPKDVILPTQKAGNPFAGRN